MSGWRKGWASTGRPCTRTYAFTNWLPMASLLAGPGPLVARPAVTVSANLAAGRITANEADVALTDIMNYPYDREGRSVTAERDYMGEHPALVRARVADPAFKQWRAWVDADPARARDVMAAIAADDPALLDRARDSSVAIV